LLLKQFNIFGEIAYMNTILAAEHVTKRFGEHTALKNVTLEIPTNSIYGLLGPNGAGKTTLIRIINQITYPDQGQVFFNGEPLRAEHIMRIGYLPEERGLYKSMKVGEQALYLAQLKGMNKADAKKKLKYWFERLDIGDWWNKKIQELSKGMAQKIQFIVTVLHEPQLLIFDEPFSGFDPINANIIKDEILRLRENGTTIIFSTHRMESVEELCEYIALIHKSEKILDGKLSAIKKEYKKNIFEVVLESSQPRELLAHINDKFNVLSSSINESDSQLDFSVQLLNGNSKELFQFLGTRANVNSFVETIPSANDIFISAVKSKGDVNG
jgi:ABC-2 type transport system ATP-binding protein